MTEQTIEKVTPETHPNYVAWKFTYDGRQWGDWYPLEPREEKYFREIAEIKADALHRSLVKQEGKDLPATELRIYRGKTTACPEDCPIQDCLTNKRANLRIWMSDFEESAP